MNVITEKVQWCINFFNDLSQGDLYRLNKYRDYDINDIKELHFSDIENIPSYTTNERIFEEQGCIIFVSTLMKGSDYSGSTLTKSNYQKFIELYGELDCVIKLSGGYNGYGIVILIAPNVEIPDSIFQTLGSLEDYPVIDEEHLSDLEIDLFQDNWDSWIYSDFKRAIDKQFDIDLDDYPVVDSDLYELFEDHRELTDTYPIFETGCTMYIDIDRIVENIDIDEIHELIGMCPIE